MEQPFYDVSGSAMPGFNRCKPIHRSSVPQSGVVSGQIKFVFLGNLRLCEERKSHTLAFLQTHPKNSSKQWLVSMSFAGESRASDGRSRCAAVLTTN